MRHSQDEILRILETDYRKNHSGREYSLAYVVDVMNKWVGSGGYLYCAPNVMFVGEVNGEVFEFHSVNGGSGKDLTDGINQLLASLALHYTTAVTYYDNPAVNGLTRFINFPATITCIDEGLDRTFEMRFDLRS